MATDWISWMDEDETCLNCGELNFHQSKTLGICLECAYELLTGSFKDDQKLETIS